MVVGEGGGNANPNPNSNPKPNPNPPVMGDRAWMLRLVIAAVMDAALWKDAPPTEFSRLKPGNMD